MKQSHPNYIPELDGLRGIAALLVLWEHLPREPLGQLLTRCSIILQPGYLGVDLFFVLSGFLITRLLIADRGRKGSLPRFLIRRSLRIFPIYYLTLLVLLAVEPGRYLAWCAIYVSNFVFAIDLTANPMRHTWSLAVEEHFYIFWPFFVHAFLTERLRLACFWLMGIAIALATATIVFVEAPPSPNDLILRCTCFRILSLVAGALLAIEEKRIIAQGKRFRWIAALLIGLAVLLVGGFRFLPLAESLGYEFLPVAKLVGFSMLCTGIILWTVIGQNSHSPIRLLLRGKILGQVGRVSYGLYLYHFPVFYFFGFRDFDAAPPTIGKLAMALAVTIFVTFASYHFIEAPILRLKDRFR